MWRERGLTMVLVTHDSSIARRAQRIGVMKNGRLGFRQPPPGPAAQVQAARTDASVNTEDDADPEEDADLDSELPDFDDPDSESADTITFD